MLARAPASWASAGGPESPSGSGLYAILCLTAPGATGSWPRSLEWILNAENRKTAYLVLQASGAPDDPKALEEALDRFRPRFVVSRRALPPPSIATIRSRGLPLLTVPVSARDGDSSIEETARTIMSRSAEPASSDATAPLRRAAAYRSIARAHRDLADDGAGTNIVSPLASAASDPDALRMLVRMEVELGSLGLALRDADLYAAAPGLTSAQRSEAFCGAGRVRVLLGDEPGSARDFRRALELNPGEAAASFALAEALRDRPEEALPYAERAARTAATVKGRGAAYRLAGEIRLDLGDAAGAKADIARALRLTGDDLDALRDMVRLARGRPKEAFAYARRADGAAERVPLWSRPSADRLCAAIWLEIEDYPKAIGRLKRAIEADPDDLDALEALVRIRGERPEEAGAAADASEPGAPRSDAGARTEKTLDRAPRSDPDDLEALRRLIELERSRDRPSEAVGLAERFIDAVPRAPVWQQPDAYRLGVKIWIELGDVSRAQESATHAEDLDHRALEPSLALNSPADVEAAVTAYGAIGAARGALQDYAGAEESLKRALELSEDESKSRELLSKLIDLELSRGRPLEATAYADRLLEASRQAPPGGLAVAYRREARIRLELGDAAGAWPALKRALALDRGDIGELPALVRLETGLRRPAEALAAVAYALKTARKAPPFQRAECYWLKGRLEFELKNEVEAGNDFRRAIEAAPASAPERRQDLLKLFQDSRSQGRSSEALAYAGALIAVSENDPPSERAAAYRRRAGLRFELDDRAGARRDFARAFDSAPEDPGVLSMLAAAERARPQAVWDLVAGRRPAGARVRGAWLALRGLARAVRHDEAGAQDDFSAAVAADPTGVCFGELFQAHRESLDPAFFDRCVERFPRDATLYSDRGVARYESGRTDGAVADFRRAVELKPDYLVARLNLASALAAQEHRAEALEETEKAVDAAKDRKSPVYGRILELQAALRAEDAKTR